MRRLWLLSFLLVLAGCAGPTAPSGAPETAIFHARGLLLGPGEEIRLGVEAGTRGIDLRPAFAPSQARFFACPLADIEAPTPPIAECTRDISQGVRTPLKGAAHALRLESDAPIRLDLVVEYYGGGRVEIRYPRVPPAPSVEACRDHGCDVFFERLPVRDGRLTVTASYEGPSGRVLIEQGRVLARSATATGVPYRIAGETEGESPRSLSVGVSENAEYAVAVHQRPGPNARGLRNLRVVMEWPN